MRARDKHARLRDAQLNGDLPADAARNIGVEHEQVERAHEDALVAVHQKERGRQQRVVHTGRDAGDMRVTG